MVGPQIGGFIEHEAWKGLYRSTRIQFSRFTRGKLEANRGGKGLLSIIQ